MWITRSAFFSCVLATAASCRDARDRTENISTGTSDMALRAAGVDDLPAMRLPLPHRTTNIEVSSSGEAIVKETNRSEGSSEPDRMARQRTGATRGTSPATSGGTRLESGAGAGAHSSYPESDTGVDAGINVDGGLPEQPDR